MTMGNEDNDVRVADWWVNLSSRELRRRGGGRALTTLCVVVFTFQLVFIKQEGPGWKWPKPQLPPSAVLREVPEPAAGGAEAQARQLSQGAIEQVELHDALAPRDPGRGVPTPLLRA